MCRISVVVPIYYGEKYIPDIIVQIENCKECLDIDDSLEIVFINDAPKEPICREWNSEKINIIIVNSDKNLGIHGARVKGLMKCHGEYVLFLDQDDKIEPEYFQSQLRAIGENEAVICRAMNGGKEFYTDDKVFKNMIKKEFLLKEWNWIISPGQVLIRRQAIPCKWTQDIMHYNGADDWLLWICMMAEGYHFSLNDSILYNHVLNDLNTSNNVVAMAQSEQELIRIVKERNILSDADFRLLIDGFLDRNMETIQELYYIGENAKKKLNILDRWMELKKKDIKYSEYLQQKGIQSVAIYGCGTLGEFLYTELKSDIDVKCFVDKNAAKLSKGIPVYTLRDSIPEVDGIIISLVGGTENVEKGVREKGYRNIFILENWLIEVMSSLGDQTNERIC